MLVAAALCPHPPLLLPEVAQVAAAELAGLRDACAAALAELAAVQPDVLVLVGAGELSQDWPASAPGSMQGFGADLAGVSARDARAGADRLPLSLTIGGWLLETSPYAEPDSFEQVQRFAVAAGATVQECERWGRQLAQRADRVALLVMGDGTARLSPAAPGAYDERAGAYDESVRTAVSTADAAALLALDPVLSDELMVAGRAPWQVLAGACGMAQLDAEVLYDEAPYGVRYLVAVWTHHG